MSQKMQIKPTKPTLVMGLIVAVAMLVFGVFFFNAVLSDGGGEHGGEDQGTHAGSGAAGAGSRAVVIASRTCAAH